LLVGNVTPPHIGNGALYSSQDFGLGGKRFSPANLVVTKIRPPGDKALDPPLPAACNIG